MEHKFDTVKQLQSKLSLIVADDYLTIPRDMYIMVKDPIRNHAAAIRCTEHYYEIPNCYPAPNSTGVQILFKAREKKLKDLNYRDFEGYWLREDTKAEYRMRKHNGIATLWNRTKTFNFSVAQPSSGTFLRFNQIQFKLVKYSKDSFSIQVNDKVVTFTKISDL